MVGVMTMTPVHVRTAGHDAAHTLRLVGMILSAHIAGMFAFAPVFGWLTDRLGRRPVVGIGIVLLLAACAVAAPQGMLPMARRWVDAPGTGLVGHDGGRIDMLSESVPVDLRASAQGLSDLAMGLAGATAGALRGWSSNTGDIRRWRDWRRSRRCRSPRCSPGSSGGGRRRRPRRITS